MVQERARELNRIQKVLEGANIKLASVVSDIDGKSSRRMLEMLISCPGNNESAGKRKSDKTRKGSDILKATLIECAKVAGHLKNTYFSSQYTRIAARRGKNRATGIDNRTLLTDSVNNISKESDFCAIK